jgi:hypothetical protein
MEVASVGDERMRKTFMNKLCMVNVPSAANASAMFDLNQHD